MFEKYVVGLHTSPSIVLFIKTKLTRKIYHYLSQICTTHSFTRQASNEIILSVTSATVSN